MDSVLDPSVTLAIISILPVLAIIVHYTLKNEHRLTRLETRMDLLLSHFSIDLPKEEGR